MSERSILRYCLFLLLLAPVSAPAQTAPPFFARHYGGKCLDFGAPPQAPGSPVFLYECNGTVAQQIRVQEINSRHEVILHAGSLVIGVKQDPPDNTTGSSQPAASVVPADAPLELQTPARLTVFSGAQIFALDGDSIILAANRNLVVNAPPGRWGNRTPLVLGRRDVADNEYWTFSPADGTGAKLTSGFVRVPQESTLGNALRIAGQGTVIDIDPNAAINLQYEDVPLTVPPGVTIRGGRNASQAGAEVFLPYKNNYDTFVLRMLVVGGNDVRITGLRLRGPSRGRAQSLQEAQGIVTDPAFNTIIDRNEMSEWPGAAVHVLGNNDTIVCSSLYPPSRPETVRIVRNLFHNNERWKSGYGVVMGAGGYALIERNTFSYNRHAIADDGTAFSGYRAFFNLVLAGVPTYSGSESGTFWGRGPQQDFDMHGTDPASGSSYVGGVAGLYLESTRNTFLSSGDFSRHNFELRGTPCYFYELHSNVTLENLQDSIEYDGSVGKLIITGDNRFTALNSTDHLGVGDFDGDRKDDLFLATGAAWYYAPAGAAEWRYLNGMTEGMGSLLFGDFDGDGRTDVFTQRGRDWLVSWGGVSPWEKINESDAQMSDFRIGDFDGDGHADVFYADGQNWRVSRGGVGAFEFLNTSGFRVADLRFGDFNNDRRTDIFTASGGQWKISYGGTSAWSPLPHALTSSVQGLIVADFNGDGRADIATVVPRFTGGLATTVLQVSFGGTSDWITLRTFGWPLSVASIGDFNGSHTVDMLIWHENYLDISSGGTGAPQRWSQYDMR
jgi:hypothetical protein